MSEYRNEEGSEREKCQNIEVEVEDSRRNVRIEYRGGSRG